MILEADLVLAGGAGFDLSDAIGSALADYESVWDEAFANAANKAQEYADAICKAFSDAFKTGDFSNIGRFISDNLTKALNSIEWEKVYEGAKFFGRGLATFLNGLITPEEFAAIGRTIARCYEYGCLFCSVIRSESGLDEHWSVYCNRYQ